MYTAIIIRWLQKHEYSKQHWKTVSIEMLEKADQDPKKAVIFLADAIKAFHYQYRDAVVKNDNVLHDLISSSYDTVDWKSVARIWYTDVNP